MEDVESLRRRAGQYRLMAQHPDRGTADALIEAACALELEAARRELAVPSPTGRPPGPARRAVRLFRDA